MDQDEFTRILTTSLSSSAPIRSPEYLRGRDKALRGLTEALAMPGRHAFIHGFKGVGKTSLAETAASVLQSADAQPIRVTCDHKTTFASLARDIWLQGTKQAPNMAITEKAKGEINLAMFKGSYSKDHHETPRDLPQSVSEAIQMIEDVQGIHSRRPVVVVDEFDTIGLDESRREISLFLKGISDRHLGIKFIICGIGESLEKLLTSHGSAHRFLHVIRLERLDYQSCIEIVDTPIRNLGVSIDDTTKYRIVRVSDGFPFYVHIQTEKTLWCWFRKGASGPVGPMHYVEGIKEASESVGPELKEPYEKVVKKYKSDGEHILWAMADRHELDRQIRDIYSDYQRLSRKYDWGELTYNQFSARLSNFTKESYDCVLTSPRRSWYEYSEKMMRGYARLMAEQKNIELEADHPLLKRGRVGVSLI